VPEAKQLLTDAVRKLSVQDAKGILSGGDTAATDYFQRATRTQLTQRFLPIVKNATDAVARVKEDEASIERYVTQKALDGLYFMIGEQEKAFRRDPVGATSSIVRKVFGAIR